MMALAEIKMLNQQRKTDIKSRHIAVDPPNLASDETSVRKFNMRQGDELRDAGYERQSSC